MRERIDSALLRLAGPLGVALVLGLVGPFGTYELLPPGPRLLYWLAVVALNWVLCDIGIRRVEGVVPDTLTGSLRVRRLLVPLTGAALVALPATGVVALANGLSGIGWPQSILTLFAQVALLLAAISVPVYAWADLNETAAPPPATDASLPSGLALFQARLPRPFSGRLLCLEMQDHYLSVHTTTGSMMILCRMEEAARELEGLGLRVHRSWWVATEALEAIERDGQKLTVRLTDGRRIPVGRTFRAALKSAGWLQAGSSAS